MTTYTPHPIAEMFPMMTGEAFEKFKEDIRTQGQLEPIVIYDGILLDGRNRLKACQELGIEPLVKQYDGDSPVAFIMSHNLNRRHLDASQRASISTEILPHLEAEAKKRQGARNDIHEHSGNIAGKLGDAREQAAKLLNVSPRMISDAKRIKQTSPELFEKVKAGEMTVNKAIKQINEDKEEEKPRIKTYDEEVNESASPKPETIRQREKRDSRELANDVFIWNKFLRLWKKFPIICKRRFVSERLPEQVEKIGRESFQRIMEVLNDQH